MYVANKQRVLIQSTDVLRYFNRYRETLHGSSVSSSYVGTTTVYVQLGYWLRAYFHLRTYFRYSGTEVSVSLWLCPRWFFHRFKENFHEHSGVFGVLLHLDFQFFKYNIWCSLANKVKRAVRSSKRLPVQTLIKISPAVLDLKLQGTKIIFI
jgi:hypothetical protein